jgi:hypothetical protein
MKVTHGIDFIPLDPNSERHQDLLAKADLTKLNNFILSKIPSNERKGYGDKLVWFIKTNLYDK